MQVLAGNHGVSAQHSLNEMFYHGRLIQQTVLGPHTALKLFSELFPKLQHNFLITG